MTEPAEPEGIVLRRRGPHERLRYLAGKLRDGTGAPDVVAFALDVLADELDLPQVTFVAVPDSTMTDDQLREFKELLAAVRPATAFRHAEHKVPPPHAGSPLDWLRYLDDGDFRLFAGELCDAHFDLRKSGDPVPLEKCLREWRMTAEALSDPARREVLTGPLADEDFVEVGPPGEPDLCRQCDVFIGYGGAGVAKPPDEYADDREWLGSHCWVCGRSRDEIRAAGR